MENTSDPINREILFPGESSSQSTSGLLSIANPQTKSLLFKLPQEIRDKIYAQLFLTTPLDIANPPNPGLSAGITQGPARNYYGTRPDRNPLAILYTCRRARAETGDSWISSLTFSFTSGYTMLDKLTAAPPGALQRIRHLYIKSDSLKVQLHSADTLYPLAAALVFLPGLQLDTLAVESCGEDMIGNVALDAFVRESSGWRELRFFAGMPVFLGMAWHHTFNGRGLGPIQWQRALEARDGASSGSSVTTYRSAISRESHSAFEKAIPWKGRPGGFKETAVVVRRGDGADCEVRASPPLLEHDTRHYFPGGQWKDIRKKHVRHSHFNDDYSIYDDGYPYYDDYGYSNYDDGGYSYYDDEY